MKINVERGAFLKALGHIQSVVERRNTIPILSNVLIEAAKGRLKLTATDLDIEIIESIPADVLRNGASTAPAHMLYDIVRKMPEGAQVQAELVSGDAGRLIVSAGAIRFELACLLVDKEENGVVGSEQLKGDVEDFIEQTLLITLEAHLAVELMGNSEFLVVQPQSADVGELVRWSKLGFLFVRKLGQEGGRRLRAGDDGHVG